MISIARLALPPCSISLSQGDPHAQPSLESLATQTKILLCTFVYLCGITLAWLVDM